jgi:hypothetical protein
MPLGPGIVPRVGPQRAGWAAHGGPGAARPAGGAAAVTPGTGGAFKLAAGVLSARVPYCGVQVPSELQLQREFVLPCSDSPERRFNQAALVTVTPGPAPAGSHRGKMGDSDVDDEQLENYLRKKDGN